MTTRRNKHVLKAAKDAVAEKFTVKLQELQDQYDELIHAEGASDKAYDVAQQMRDVRDEWDEWKVRSKKNKKKVGKRVEWTNQREQAPMRTINQDALQELRQARRENAKPTVGIDWLYEGALVTERGKSEMMIVTRVTPGGKAECLKNGATQWYRGVSLRPADWMMED